MQCDEGRLERNIKLRRESCRQEFANKRGDTRNLAAEGKDAPGQVEVVAAGKSWAASPHLYAYQPAHFHFQEEQLDLGVAKT